MRINHDNKSVDMEQRDINYILPAYVRSYLFYTRNELPEKIIFPMFPSVTVQGKEIPIEYVPPLDAIAVEIAEDGAGIPEVTPEEEVALDEKDDRIKELKEEVASLTPAPEDIIRQQQEAIEQLEDDTADKQLELDTTPEEVSPAKAAFAEAPKLAGKDPEVKGIPVRLPKQPPGGDIGPGLGLSDMQARDRRDQSRVAKDLKEEPDINEAEEKEFEKPITRDKDGKPVVEDKDS